MRIISRSNFKRMLKTEIHVNIRSKIATRLQVHARSNSKATIREFENWPIVTETWSNNRREKKNYTSYNNVLLAIPAGMIRIVWSRRNRKPKPREDARRRFDCIRAIFPPAMRRNIFDSGWFAITLFRSKGRIWRESLRHSITLSCCVVMYPTDEIKWISLSIYVRAKRWTAIIICDVMFSR